MFTRFGRLGIAAFTGLPSKFTGFGGPGIVAFTGLPSMRDSPDPDLTHFR